MVTPAVRREAVAHLRDAHEMSERRACRVIGCDRMTVRYRSRRPDDPRLRERLVALANERRRFGYRRLLIFLRWEGFVVNHKRLFRIYCEQRLMVCKRGGRKRALGARAPMPGAARPNGPLVVRLRLGSARGASVFSAFMTIAPGNAWRRWPMSHCRGAGLPASSIF